jgi:hypothetical protein
MYKPVEGSKDKFERRLDDEVENKDEYIHRREALR